MKQRKTKNDYTSTAEDRTEITERNSLVHLTAEKFSLLAVAGTILSEALLVTFLNRAFWFHAWQTCWKNGLPRRPCFVRSSSSLILPVLECTCLMLL